MGRPGGGEMGTEPAAGFCGAHVMRLDGLDGRGDGIGEQVAPVELQFFDPDLVESDEILHGPVRGRVFAVDELQVEPGLDGLDERIPDDVGRPAEDVSELAFAGSISTT